MMVVEGWWVLFQIPTHSWASEPPPGATTYSTWPHCLYPCQHRRTHFWAFNLGRPRWFCLNSIITSLKFGSITITSQLILLPRIVLEHYYFNGVHFWFIFLVQLSILVIKSWLLYLNMRVKGSRYSLTTQYSKQVE